MKKKRHPLPEITTKYHEQLIKKTRSPATSVPAATLGMVLLWLADDWQAAVNKDLGQHGISENKLGMLILLHLARDQFSTDITPSELADLVGVERASVTGILDWLENRKFIRRIPDPVDRRKVTISLNSRSQKEYESILKTYWKSCADLVGDLTAVEQNALSKLAETMLLAVKKRSPSSQAQPAARPTEAKSGKTGIIAARRRSASKQPNRKT
ncbi:MAG: MarR family transcriptional regulator [Spirochaetia bacterium]|nr:MarR family transcriptional regulator [Spirochaetia bacterium]